MESQKNSGLLAEYHDLYELQRRRLEKQVSMLAEEKEIWSTAAYSLALKVRKYEARLPTKCTGPVHVYLKYKITGTFNSFCNK